MQYTIDAQPLDQALRQFAAQANLQLLFRQEDLAGKRSNGLKGTYTHEDAIKRLLAGSGLNFELVKSDAVLISRPDGRRAFKEDKAPSQRDTPSAANRDAANSNTPPFYGLEEVVVSARRVQENLQSVPISVTAFSPKVLHQNDIHALTDLQRTIPGLQVCCGPALSTGTAVIYLRGIPGVVGYFAEVPTPLNGYGLYFDLSSIAALKGPQGTLFGLSTDGGAILYEPARPIESLERFGEFTLGTYTRTTLEGMANVPLAEDRLLARGAFTVSHTDGFLTNLATGEDLGDQNYGAGRLSFIWRPIDQFEDYTVLNYYSFRGRPLPALLVGVNQDGMAGKIFGLPALNAALAGQQQLGSYKIAGLSVSDTTIRTRQFHAVNIASWSPRETLTIKNIAGYVDSHNFLRQDLEGTLFPISDTVQPLSRPSSHTPTWSEELQLLGSLAAKHFKYTVGTFHTGSVTGAIPVDSISLGSPRQTLTKTAGNTHAIYAQGDFDLSPLLPGAILTAGYRYTWDTRRLRQMRFSGGALLSDSGALVGNFHAGSYLVSLAYHLTPDTMVFVTNSKGYSSGGFNPTAPAELQRYNPESLNNIEAGIKSEWTFRSVVARTNFSVFHGFYNNVQVTTTQQVSTPAGPTLSVVIDNAANAHLNGIEGEVTLIPRPDFEISGNFSYFRNIYDSYMTLSATGAPVDNSGLGFSYAPRWKYALNATHHLPIDRAFGEVSISAQWSWQSSVLTQPTASPRPVDGIQHFGQLNLTLDWRAIGGVSGFDASLFSTNVNQNHRTQGGFGAFDAVGIVGRYGAEPRMVGARVSYRY